MRRKFSLAVVGVAVIAIAVATGYSATAHSATKGVSPLPSSSCGPVVYKGSGSPDFIIPSDLPLQGAIRQQTVQISRAMIWALAEAGWKAGPYKIGYQSCDDSTAQTGGWDTAKCATNGHLFANDKSVIGVLGTFNSGCAKIEVPILNRAGPLAMVSPANTNPGLTKKWDVGEPQKYYPTGTRNYARVVATDDIQGPADAIWSQKLGLKKVYILNDKQTYGFGVATTYRSAAKKLGIQVVGFQGWDAKATSYEALATSIKASGAQAVFLGGIICNNGAKLMQDIKCRRSEDPAPDALTASATRTGTVRSANGGVHQRRRRAAEHADGHRRDVRQELRRSRSGTTPNPYAAYGAQAMDVMLQAVAKSGGQRAARNQGHLRPHGHERHPGNVHHQLERRYEPRPDHDLQAGRDIAQPVQEAREHDRAYRLDLIG